MGGVNISHAFHHNFPRNEQKPSETKIKYLVVASEVDLLLSEDLGLEIKRSEGLDRRDGNHFGTES